MTLSRADVERIRDAATPHIQYFVDSHQVRDLATTALAAMDERDSLRLAFESASDSADTADAWRDAAERNAAIIQQRVYAAEARIAALMEALRHLFDVADYATREWSEEKRRCLRCADYRALLSERDMEKGGAE